MFIAIVDKDADKKKNEKDKLTTSHEVVLILKLIFF